MTLQEGDERTAAQRIRDAAASARTMALVNEFDDLAEDLEEIADGLEVSAQLLRARSARL